MAEGSMYWALSATLQRQMYSEIYDERIRKI